MTAEYAAAIIGSHEEMMLSLRFAGAVLTSVVVLLPVSRSETKGASPPDSHPTRAAESREPELRFDHVTADALRALADYRLAESQARLERLHAVRGRRTVENTLQPYDDLVRASLNHWVFGLLSRYHPDAEIRAAAGEQFRRLRAFDDTIQQDPQLLQALAPIHAGRTDAETRFYIRRELNAFRAAGVDRDEATRRQIQALREEIRQLAEQFQVNLRQSRQLVFANPAELEGVPADWLARQRRGPAGEVIIDREFDGVARFAKDPAARERAMVHQNNQAAPANHAILERLLAARHDLAVTLGYRTWAEYQLKDSMAGAPGRVTQFLDTIETLAAPAMEREHARALELLRAELPGLTSIPMRDRAYAQRKFVSQRANVDLARVREYFPYDRVRDGLLRLAGDLFGVEFRTVPDAPVWDPSVEVYDAFDGARPLGRVYLDTLKRPDRVSAVNGETAAFSLGVPGKSLPEVAVAGAFRQARSGDPNLLEPLQVSSLFHEFGHVLNFLLGMRRWAGTSGEPDERDFVEVPSIFFEQWSHDRDVLRTFARHYQTGEPLPPDIAAFFTRNDQSANMFRLPIVEWEARLALALHNQTTRDVDVDRLVRETMERWFPFRPPAAEIHPEASMFHLSGYAAARYAYLWDDVIAKDLRRRFHRGLLDRDAARLFRRTILEGGRSAPGAKLVERFLGRPFSVDAWSRWVAAADNRSSAPAPRSPQRPN